MPTVPTVAYQTAALYQSSRSVYLFAHLRPDSSITAVQPMNARW